MSLMASFTQYYIHEIHPYCCMWFRNVNSHCPVGIHLSILLTGIWLVFRSWLLQIIFLWIFEYMSFNEQMCVFLWGIYWWEDLLGCRLWMWFSSSRYGQFSQVIVANSYIYHRFMRVPVAPHPCPYLVFMSFFSFVLLVIISTCIF